jgi:hypothetical protein
LGGGQNILDTRTIFSDTITIFSVGSKFSLHAHNFLRRAQFFEAEGSFLDIRIIFWTDALFFEGQYFLDLPTIFGGANNSLDSRTVSLDRRTIFCSGGK